MMPTTVPMFDSLSSDVSDKLPAPEKIWGALAGLAGGCDEEITTLTFSTAVMVTPSALDRLSVVWVPMLVARWSASDWL